MQIDRARILLTGANRGIGRALALALRDAGAAKIYLGARRPETLAPLLAIDDRCFAPVRLDITDQGLVDGVAAQAADVSLLINNAGIITFGNALDVPFAAIEDTIR